jgi:predicted RNA-binding protein YlqC (UPF0109 family)
MKSLLEFLLLRIVENPESLEIIEEEANGLHIYKLRLHPDDVGRVIGRGGKVIRALRKIAQVRAVKDHLRVRVEIDE